MEAILLFHQRLVEDIATLAKNIPSICQVNSDIARGMLCDLWSRLRCGPTLDAWQDHLSTLYPSADIQGLVILFTELQTRPYFHDELSEGLSVAFRNIQFAHCVMDSKVADLAFLHGIDTTPALLALSQLERQKNTLLDLDNANLLTIRNLCSETQIRKTLRAKIGPWVDHLDFRKVFLWGDYVAAIVSGRAPMVGSVIRIGITQAEARKHPDSAFRLSRRLAQVLHTTAHGCTKNPTKMIVTAPENSSWKKIVIQATSIRTVLEQPFPFQRCLVRTVVYVSPSWLAQDSLRWSSRPELRQRQKERLPIVKEAGLHPYTREEYLSKRRESLDVDSSEAKM